MPVALSHYAPLSVIGMLLTTPKQGYKAKRGAVTVISVMFLKSYRVLYPLLLILGTFGGLYLFLAREYEWLVQGRVHNLLLGYSAHRRITDDAYGDVNEIEARRREARCLSKLLALRYHPVAQVVISLESRIEA